jgi:hypothetical protein
MRNVVACLICLLAAPVAALAADAQPDVTLVVGAQEQAAWGQVSAVMDKCVADAVLRSQAPSCRDLAGFLDAWAAKVKAAKPAEAPGN